jgi:FMN reductase
VQLTESSRSSASVLVVVGNPKPASRTRAVGEAVAAAVADWAGVSGWPAMTDVLEVADIGPHLLGWGDPDAAAAVGRLLDADVLVVASPVFKATYTGLLKLLFDQVGAGQLAGTVAIPVMVGAGPAHALAVDVHLRPLLVEVGAACPTSGLYVLDSTLDSLDDQIDRWAESARRPLLGALALPASVGTVTG